MIIDRVRKVVEYPEATYAREDKGSLVIVRRSDSGGVAEALGSIAKGHWTRWHFSDVVVSEPADPIALDES